MGNRRNAKHSNSFVSHCKVNESVDDFISRLKRAQKDATAAIELMNTEMKKQTDKHRRPSNNIAIGTEVWLDASDIKIPNAPKTMKKLSDKHVGPFKVLEKVGASAYKLELPEQWKIHPTFNESKLTPYIPPLVQHQKRPPPPPPEVVGGHERYKVNEILNSRKKGRYGIEYPSTGKATDPKIAHGQSQATSKRTTQSRSSTRSTQTGLSPTSRRQPTSDSPTLRNDHTSIGSHSPQTSLTRTFLEYTDQPWLQCQNRS